MIQRLEFGRASGDEREDVDDAAESNLKASELVLDLEADIITAGDNLKHNDKNE